MRGSVNRWILGVDTGGTYTDAVVYDEGSNSVLAKAKAPTTHDDLAVGIGAAIQRALAAGPVEPGAVSFVSLSSTLATNALVEGKGRPAALVMIGFEEAVLDRGGLREAVGGDPVVMVAGGHTPHGAEAEPLDTETLAVAVTEIAPSVDGFAVTSQFSVRNADHEIAARDLIRERTGLPVTCSHELADALDGPKRSVTALLNARMIALIDELVSTTTEVLAQSGVDAPIMMVRGNGSLVSADFVRERPVETILSGPAASLLGAAHLVGASDAVISDIGGTTTDIAALRDGKFDLGARGATVGGHRTMIEAVAMATHGLGGDSEVLLADRARGAELTVGPRRVVPLVVTAQSHGDYLLSQLRRQLNAETLPQQWSSVFLTLTAKAAQGSSDRGERRLMERIGSGIVAADTVVEGSRDALAVRRLGARGLLRVSAFTPTDASHVLGTQTTHDPAVAQAAAEVWSRRCDHRGKMIVEEPREFAEAVVKRLVRQSAEKLLAMAFASDGLSEAAAASEVVAAALDDRPRTSRLAVGLGVPLVALGAPAATYYPAIGELLGTEVEIPEHADVANAVGAAVGKVRLRRRVTVSSPRRGLYRVHVGAEPDSFFELEPAKQAAIDQANTAVAAAMAAAGAPEFELETLWDEKSVDLRGRKLFVEGVATVIGTGRPQLNCPQLK